MEKFVNLTAVFLTAVVFGNCGFAAKASDSDNLPFAPVPWVDGEMMQLKVTSPQTDELGVVFYSAQRQTQNPRLDPSGWEMISQSYLTAADSGQYTQVATAAENFRPSFSRTVNLLGDFTAQYQPGKVKLAGTGPQGEIKRDVDVNSVVYDNEQLVHLLRRLPLQNGFKASFILFAIISGQTVDCSIAVAGKEKITVPAGSFDCFKVNLLMHAGQEKPTEQTLWLSADPHRYLVKYVTDTSTILRLDKVSRIEKDSPLTFEDDQLGFSVSVPYDWRFYKHAAGPGFFLELLTPKLKAKAVLCIMPASSGVNPMEVTRSEVKVFKKIFKGYTVRDNELMETSIGPLKAVQYVADFIEEANAARRYIQPKEMVEYRTYIVGKDKVYFFVFRAEKDKFDGLKSEFDAIIQSFEIKP